MAPPLGCQDSIISIEYYAKLRHRHPFVIWTKALSTQMVGEDVCFWPAPQFGQKIGLDLSEDLSFFFLVSTQIWAKNRTKFE